MKPEKSIIRQEGWWRRKGEYPEIRLAGRVIELFLLDFYHFIIIKWLLRQQAVNGIP